MLDNYDRNNIIVHQDDDKRFEKNAHDPDIIRIVAGDPGPPVWVSADIEQKRNPLERLALRESGMTCVFFKGFHGKKSQTFRFQAIKILTVWDDVCAQCQRCRQPTVFEVGGKMTTSKVESRGLTAKVFA